MFDDLVLQIKYFLVAVLAIREMNQDPCGFKLEVAHQLVCVVAKVQHLGNHLNNISLLHNLINLLLRILIVILCEFQPNFG